jgi:hypothetical protein
VLNDNLIHTGSIGQISQWKFVASSVSDRDDLIGFDAINASGSSNATSVVLTGSNIIQGIDWPFAISSTNAMSVRNAGDQFVVRYYHNDSSNLDNLTNNERVILENANLKIVTVWENKSTQQSLGVGAFSNGTSDANAAITEAKAAGQEANSAIYFAVDLNVVSSIATIEQYFSQIKATFSNSAVNDQHYKIGVYGSGFVGNTLLSDNYVSYVWLASAAYLWQGTSTDNSWNISQVGTTDSLTVPMSNLDPNSRIQVGNLLGVDINVAKGDFGAFGFTTVHVVPTVNVHDVSVAANGSIAASSLVTSVSNPSGDSITQYVFWDGGSGGGHFVVGGAVQPAGQNLYVDFSNVDNAQYVGGSSAGSETLYVAVYDATTNSYSDFSSLTATTTQANTAAKGPVNDFNGDGKSDILWRNDAGAVATWDMNDGTLLSSNPLGVVPANWHIAGTGDFNGDHKSDILWRNDAGAVAIWDMNDGNLLSSNPLGVVPANWHIAGVGDFNGDDKADILWRNDAGAIATWDMNDGTLLSSNSLGSVPDNWKIAGTGDFNGDHKTDILWRNDAGAVAIWDMNDGNILASNPLGVVPANWHIAGVGDFNGDNKADILWRNDAGAIATWDMNDGTLVASNPLGSVPANWKIAGIGDYNGDHKSDILWRNDNGPVAIWDMNDGTLLASNPLGSVPANWHIIA